MAERRRGTASEALDIADRLLEGAREEGSDEWARTWVDVQLMRGFNYFYDDPELLGSVIARARPLVKGGRGRNKRLISTLRLGTSAPPPSGSWSTTRSLVTSWTPGVS